jgi:hypothetical protein
MQPVVFARQGGRPLQTQTIQQLYIHKNPSSNGAERIRVADFVLYPELSSQPRSIINGREELTEFIGTWRDCCPVLETEILGCYLEGLSYREIAAVVYESPKSVDNAVHAPEGSWPIFGDSREPCRAYFSPVPRVRRTFQDVGENIHGQD